MIKVGVVFGGESVEHEVSIISAVQAMNYLDTNKYEVVPIYISKDRKMFTGKKLREMKTYKNLENIGSLATEVILINEEGNFVLKKKKGLWNKVIDFIDVAFPIVHGKGVEDGSLSGYFETIGIPYVGSSVLGSSIGQDKVIQKQIMESSSIPVVNYIWFYDFEYLEKEKEILKKVKELKYPVIVKPARLGSSVGITVAHNEKEAKTSIEEAISYDEKVIIEQMVQHLLEVDCAVLGNKENMECSLIGEMLTENELLTFEDKYIGDGAKGGKSGVKSENTIASGGFKIPAILDKEIEENVYKYAKEAFRCLNLSGITRFDFLVDKETKQVYVNEPNTIPGSLAFFFYTPKGKTYTKLLDELISGAIKDYKKAKKKVTSFESNVLSTFDGGAKGAKGAKGIN